jgi:hypothetical protein
MSREREIKAAFKKVQSLATRRDAKMREAEMIDRARREAARRLAFLVATREPITVTIEWT